MTVRDSKPASDLTTLARGGSLNLVGSAVGALLAMGLILVVTRGLGEDAAGALFETIALFNIVVIAVTFGADTGLLRFTARSMALGEPLRSGRLLAIGITPVIVVGFAATAVALLLGDSIAGWLGGDHADTVRTYLGVMALFVPVGAVALAVLGATRGFGTMLPTVAADRILRPLVQIVLVALAAFAGASFSAVAWAWSLGIAASLVTSLVWLQALVRSRRVDGTTTAPTSVKEFWAFTLPRAFASIFRVGVLWLDIILVGGLISPRAAAIYTVATRLLQAGFLAVDAVGQAVEPMFSSLLAREEHARANDLFKGATGWLVGLTWPLFLAMWIFAPAVLGIFGSAYVEATAVVAILAGSALLGSGFGPVDVLLVMSGKSLWSFWNSAAALTLNVVLNLALIPSLGLTGAAMAWAASRVLANLLPLIQVRHLYGFHPFGHGWRVAAVLSLTVFGLGGLATRLVIGDGLLVFVIYTVGAVLVYIAAAWRWRTDLELAAFASMLGRRFKGAGARA